MRIHTDTLTASDLQAAAQLAGVTLSYSNHGSRSHRGAVDVTLSGSSGRMPNTGNRGAASYGSSPAATWDEWGIFLGELFRRDPDAVAPRVYFSGEHFRWATGARFDTLTPADQHKRHRWQYNGESVTGAYSVHECKCGALLRRASSPEHWHAYIADEVTA